MRVGVKDGEGVRVGVRLAMGEVRVPWKMLRTAFTTAAAVFPYLRLVCGLA